MKTPTVQPKEKWKSGKVLLKAIRSRAGNNSFEAESETTEDMALDVRYLGRDLVREISEGRKSCGEKDGKNVDIVSKTGRKLRVITRVIQKNSKGYWVAQVKSLELSPINFSQEPDKPDSVVLVAVNPQLETIAVFDFPLQEQKGAKVTKESYSVTWSEKNQNYGKAQGNLWYKYRLIRES